MNKNKGFTSGQIIIMTLSCLAIIAAYILLIYFFGRTIANNCLMIGLLAISAIVLVIKAIRRRK